MGGSSPRTGTSQGMAGAPSTKAAAPLPVRLLRIHVLAGYTYLLADDGIKVGRGFEKRIWSHVMGAENWKTSVGRWVSLICIPINHDHVK
jgi:hypothetical protein